MHTIRASQKANFSYIVRYIYLQTFCVIETQRECIHATTILSMHYSLYPLLFPLYISISPQLIFADEWDKWPLFAANSGPDQSEAQQ